jgi:hypothetical protein
MDGWMDDGRRKADVSCTRPDQTRTSGGGTCSSRGSKDAICFSDVV